MNKEKAPKLRDDDEAAKLRVQLDEHLTRVEKEREITLLTHNKLEEDERAAGIRWEIIAGFQATGAGEHRSAELNSVGD